jgi:hypothetical protein
MNGLAIAALAVVGLWLGALTMIVLVLVRQVGVLTVRSSLTRPPAALADDGPKVGSSLPAEVISTLPELAREHACLTLLSATCTPCRALAAELGGRRPEARLVALVAGRDDLAEGLVALLPPGMHVVRDPEASSLANALQIKSTPFAVVVAGGRIAGKAYLHSAADLDALVEDGGDAETRLVLHAPKEVGHVS